MRKVFSILMVSFVLVGFISCGKSKSPLAGRTYAEVDKTWDGEDYVELVKFDENELTVFRGIASLESHPDLNLRCKYVMKNKYIYSVDEKTGEREDFIYGEYNKKTDTIVWNHLSGFSCSRVADGSYDWLLPDVK